MKVLERYILRRIFVQAAGATAATLGIVWTVQALTKVNLVTSTGQSIGAFLFLATLLIPAIIPIVMPFSVLIATTQTLNTMSQDSELAVIHAAGTPKIMIYRPILIIAVIAAAITALSGNFIEPYSRQKARALVADARADLLSLLIQEGAFKEVDKNLYIQVATRGEGGHLSGLFIADSRDPDLDMIYYARDGAVVKKDKESLLLMSNGEIHRRAAKDGQVSIIRFKSYAFDLSEFAAADKKPELMPKDQTTSYLHNPDPNDRYFQKSPLLLSTEFHRRLSEWLYPLAFGIIGIGACAKARSHRVSSMALTLNAVAAAFLLRWLGMGGEDFAENHANGWPLIYLVPLLGIALPALLAWRNIPIEFPDFMRKQFEILADGAADLFNAMRIRLSGFRRNGSEAGT